MRDFCPNFLLDLVPSYRFLCFLLFLTIKPLSTVDEFLIKKATFSVEITFATLHNYFSSIQLTLPLGALTIFSLIFFFFFNNWLRKYIIVTLQHSKQTYQFPTTETSAFGLHDNAPQ